MLSAQRHDRERGFTLIELLVAMILLVIVLGGLVYAITQLAKGNGQQLTQRTSQQQALDAMEFMRSDIRAARSPALTEWDGRRETLREVIYFRRDNAPSGSPDAAHRACRGLGFVSCIQDVTYASRTQLWFRADVNSTSGWDGAECVGYVLSRGALTRYVSKQWRGCGPGSGGTRQELVDARNLQGAFTYTLRYHPAMRIGQVADPNRCVTRQLGNVPTNMRNFITSVDVDLSGIAVERTDAAKSSLRTSVQITGRTGGDYAYATGCSY